MVEAETDEPVALARVVLAIIAQYEQDHAAAPPAGVSFAQLYGALQRDPAAPVPWGHLYTAVEELVAAGQLERLGQNGFYRYRSVAAGPPTLPAPGVH